MEEQVGRGTCGLLAEQPGAKCTEHGVGVHELNVDFLPGLQRLWSCLHDRILL